MPVIPNNPTRPEAEPTGVRLKTPQLRVLRALAPGEPLTRKGLCQAANFSEGSGTLNYALNGMKLSKGNPRPHSGLIELGLIERIELDIDGVEELVFRITEAGLQALENNDVTLPEMRERLQCTNRRYLD